MERLLRQECESLHGRIAQALGGSARDCEEGILGFRRCIKRIRCALQLTAGGVGSMQRSDLDRLWAELARRLGVFRDSDAQQAKVGQLIERLPPHVREEVRQAWSAAITEPCVASSDADRKEVLRSLEADTERAIALTEALSLGDLTPSLLAGSVRHIWRRARVQSGKSWAGRSEAWLHSLRKKVQHTHIAFRLLRGRTGERGLKLEKGFDAAAKSMGELRDLSMLRRRFAAMELTRPLPPALALLRTEALRTELESVKEARKQVQKAFKSGMARVLREIEVQSGSM